MIYKTNIRARYAETDAMGIVYHANYLVWLEVARTELLKSAGYPYAKVEELGYISPVINVELNYGLPFHYDDVATIYTRVVKNTPVRTTYAYEIFPEGADPQTTKPYLTARTVHCLVKNGSFKPVAIKKAIPELYELYESILEPEDAPKRR